MSCKCSKYQTLLSEDEIKKIIRKKTGKNDFKLNNYVLSSASESPLGFLGEHITLKVNNNENEEISFFVKKLPTAVPLHLKYIEDTKAFYKEVELYKTLFEDFKNAQNKKESKWRPEFYYSRGSEMIVVEDLSQLGYKMVPERTLLDEDHILAALDSMAKMHAASIIFEEKFHQKKVETKSEKLINNDGKKTIQDIYPHLIFETEASEIKGHMGNTYCEAGVKSELGLIDLLEGYTQEEIKIIKEKLPDEMRKLMKFVKPSNKYRNVILHGDLWSNNVMFKYDEQGHVDHAMIIDFQLARYGPPAHDVTLFLHLTQTRSFRQKYQDKLIKYYYEVFSNELRQYDLDSDELYPWTVFKESCDYYHETAAITTIYFFQLILLPSEIAGKFLSSPELFHLNMFVDRSEMVRECFLTDELSRKRISEALHEVIRNYVLN